MKTLESVMPRWILGALAMAMVLAALLAGAAGATAQGSAPAAPDKPEGSAVFVGGVDLEWNEVAGADSYDVQLYLSSSGQWVDLPGENVDIALYGAGAIISGLDPVDSAYYFRVRAANAHGASDWSDYNFMSPTSHSSEGLRAMPDNVHATGTPAITGTAHVGQTLTVDTADIADGNGLDRVRFHYQWVSNDGNADADISGATDSTYDLAATDEGNTIKVRVSFNDRGGYGESLTSEATEAVSYAVQRQVVNNPATGAPTISGTAQVKRTLTADTSGIADDDGLTSVSYGYQWISNDGVNDTDITGATGSTYTLVEDDEGKTIKVRVSFTDDQGSNESLTSSATEVVAPAPVNYITVTVSEDTSDLDNIVTEFTVTWTDFDACSTDYNAYLNIEPAFETPAAQHHLGSAASDGVQISKSLTEIKGTVAGFNVEVFCGTADSGRMVSRVYVPRHHTEGPKPGSYSSEPPLETLSVSHGTLTPSFNGHTFEYVVTDVANADTRITITATPKSRYLVGIYEASHDQPRVGLSISYGPNGPPTGLDEDEYCDVSRLDDLGRLPKLTDADTETDGFQVDLYDGDNYFMIDVRPFCALGKTYHLSIPRPEGAVSLVRPNRPAGGYLSFGPSRLWSGSVPLVGDTLTADTSGVRDRDGWDESTFSYQWLADDVELTGANGSSYTVAEAELGKTMKLRASFTDGRGSEETLTSNATGIVRWPNQEPVGKPALSGNLEVGQTLRADISGISDGNGLTNAEFSYRWSGFRGPSTDSDEYTLVEGDAPPYPRGRDSCGCRLVVTYTDDHGHEEQIWSVYLTDIGVVAARSDSRATGAPTITGTARVGETLTADTSDIADDDGLTNVSYSYQWVANDGNADSDITGATDSTYTLADTDVDKTIKVRVSFTDDKGYAEELTSTSTAAVTPAISLQVAGSPATGVPVIVGTPEVGETLTVNTCDIADADGLTNVSYSYQWIAWDSSLTGTDISGATDPTYTLVDEDEGKAFRVTVSFTDDAGNDETLTSLAMAPDGFTFGNWTVNGHLRHAVTNCGATGSPTITGTAQVGEILTVDTSGIDDDDGLTNVSYSYYWFSNDGNSDTYVTGATNSTYTPVEDDEGKTIKVWVSFTDDAGNDEILTSAATAAVAPPNNPATGAPAITGTARVDETLTADTSAIADDDGLTNVSYSYQWVANDGNADSDITGATDSTYTLADTDVDKTIKVRVSFTDDAGNDETLTSAATAAVGLAVQQQVANNPATGSPAITGTAQVGETLTADTSGIADDDGLTNVSYGYQWISNDGNSDTDITDETNSTYTLAEDDEGKTIKVKVSFTDDVGNDETLTSAATAAVVPANSPATGAPAISGTAQVGETLTADTSDIEDHDGLTNVSYSYQWVANDGNADSDITGATDSTYTLADTDVDKTIKVRVSFTDDAGNDETLTSAATAAVGLAVQQQVANNPATGSPAITGTAQVGETLTADTSGIADDDGLTNVSYGYQWISNDGNSDTDITDETNSTYTLAEDDEGKTIKVKVSFTDDVGNDETLTSAATAAVVPANSPATGAPAISGTAQVGETLTADTSDIEDHDGLTNVSYSYQWVANDGNADSDITGATDSTYTLADTDVDKTIKVRVSFTDDAGNDETLTSAATAAVEAATPTDPPARPKNLAAVVNSDGSVTLTWDDPDDASVTGYQILRRNRDTDPQGEFTTINEDTGSSASTYTDDTVTPDTWYVYRIKAINSNGMSQRSKYAGAKVPAQSPPATPTGLTATAARDAVTLSWDDPGDASITGYQVLRRNRDVDQIGDFTVINSDTGSQSTGYTDSTVEPDTRYVYRIKAINAHGMSEWSDFTRANTPE